MTYYVAAERSREMPDRAANPRPGKPARLQALGECHAVRPGERLTVCDERRVEDLVAFEDTRWPGGPFGLGTGTWLCRQCEAATTG